MNDHVSTSDTSLHILVVEDDPLYTRILKKQLQRELIGEHRIEFVERLDLAKEYLESDSPDLVLTDLGLPDSRGLHTFLSLQLTDPHVPIVIFSGNDDPDVAIEAVRRGAQDYLLKGEDSPKLVRAVRFAVERKQQLETLQHELHAARKIQQQMLPHHDPVFAGFDIAGAMFPALDTAGDYYDFIIPIPAIGEDTLGIAVGDVSGHGLGPAMVMSETRACLHSFALTIDNPAGILEFTNKVLVRTRDAHFVSLILGYLDGTHSTFHYASAGHCAYWLSASGETRMLKSTGLVLGIQAGATYENAEPIPLAVNDVLLLATDGLHESFDPAGTMFGMQRVLEHIQANRDLPAAEIVSGLHDVVSQFTGDNPQDDDITVVVLKVTE